MRSNSSTTPERAITSPRQDRLERGGFVDRLVDALVERRTRRSAGVVLGISGPWGSGKSSVLNLLERRVAARYPNALVLRFDPWLVSGRDDLVAKFLNELVEALAARGAEGVEWRKAAGSMARYLDALMPLTKVTPPLIEPIASVVSKALHVVATNEGGIASLRRRVDQRLREVRAPVVVLIDELDRLEDDEVRAIAQLVRAVADFPRISYLLAYDHDRVVQALGTYPGLNRRDRIERGRAYLEKIVQFAVPLPITFEHERVALIRAELAPLIASGLLPEDFEQDERFHRLVETLADGILTTPRDVKRVVGLFRVLASMTRNEVDWIDLISYSVLASKAPHVVDEMRLDPDRYVDDPVSTIEYMRRRELARTSGVDPDSARRHLGGALLKLFDQLFPAPRGHRRADGVALPISTRRALITVQRLGLQPGDIPRSRIDELLQSEAGVVEAELVAREHDDTISALLDRLDELYPDQRAQPPLGFWEGVSRFVIADSTALPAEVLLKRNIAERLARLLIRSVIRKRTLQSAGESVIEYLRGSGEFNILPEVVRLHFFMHGVFGRRRDGAESAVLDKEATVKLGLDLSRDWKPRLIRGQILQYLVNFDPLLIMLDTDVWDDECRDYLQRSLRFSRNVDRVSLLLFGGRYMTEDAAIEKLCGRETLRRRAQWRLNRLRRSAAARSLEHGELAPLRDALERAIEGFVEPVEEI